MSAGVDDPLRTPIDVKGVRGRTEEDVLAARFEALFARLERPFGRYLAQIVADRALAEDLLQTRSMTRTRLVTSFHRCETRRRGSMALPGTAR